MTQPTEPAGPGGPAQPGQTPAGPGSGAGGAAAPAGPPTQPFTPAPATTPMPAVAAQPPAGPAGPPPPGTPGGPPAGGPPPKRPGLWKQATSTTGGLIAVIVAGCLVALLLIGLVGTGIFVATHTIASHHDGQRVGRVMPGQGMVPPGQRKRLEQGPRGGQGGPGNPGGLGGPGSLLRGAAGLGAVQHGEFTVQGSDGKPVVMTVQRGSVTAASSTSVTVKSTDGFTATYAIDANTVGAKATTLTAGDSVVVIAQKTGAKAVLIRAVRTS
jgi:hypothetical protein